MAPAKKDQHYDLSQEASRRPGDEKATTIARQAESDDNSEETLNSRTDKPSDGAAENKVSTSLDEE